MLKLLCSFIFVCLSVARADFVDYIVDSKIAQPANQNLVRLYDVRATGTNGLPFTTRMSTEGSGIPRVFGAGRAEGLGVGSGGTRAVPGGGGSSGPSQGSFIRRIDKQQAHAERMGLRDEVGGAKKTTWTNERPAASLANQPLLQEQLLAEQIANGHAFEKHILTQGEFPGWIRTRDQLKTHIENIFADSRTSTFSFKDGRSAYVHRPSSTVIIHNPKAPDGGTIFQPVMGIDDFLVKQKWK